MIRREREREIRSKREREKERLLKDSVKITNLSFCEKLTNLASHIKATHQMLPRKEDTSRVT